MKKRINITVSQEVIEEASQFINNISAYLEKCLKNFLKSRQANKEDKEFKGMSLIDYQNLYGKKFNETEVSLQFDLDTNYYHTEKEKQEHIKEKHNEFLEALKAEYYRKVKEGIL